jgi:hypothetical protein
MTLDDLEKEFWGDQREQPTRVRLARVIRALQDEMQFGDWTAWHRLNEILGDAGEKVAEYTGGMNDLSVTPATDPAPAVCEWKQLGDRHGHFTRECSKYPTTSAAGDYCSNCGKPIKFTEVK